MQHIIDTLVRQFEQGKLTRRHLVQGLAVIAAAPVAGQERPAGLFRATGIDHVQITVSDLKSSQQFYEKLFGGASRSPNSTQFDLAVGTAGDFVSVHSESGRIKPIDHFGVTVETFSPDAAVAAIERMMPGTKAERSANSVFVTGPEGARVQLMAAARK
jgi:catechol-2,3-dioxygenase